MIDSMIDRAVDEELKTASWSDFVVDYGVFEFSWSDSIDGIRFRNYRSIIEKKFGKWIIRAFSSLFYSTNKVLVKFFHRRDNLIFGVVFGMNGINEISGQVSISSRRNYASLNFNR